MGIVEFLHARLDEDAKTAKAAAETAGHETWDAFGNPEDEIASVGVEHPDYPDGEEWYLLNGNLLRQSGQRPLVEHVAHHDPARVLREVEAKRSVLDLRDGLCDLLAELREDGFRTTHTEAGIESYDHVIRHLAAVYSDHPDYQQEWTL